MLKYKDAVSLSRICFILITLYQMDNFSLYISYVLFMLGSVKYIITILAR